MPSKGFAELRVYRLSETLADAVWGLVVDWTRLAQDTVGKQLVRAVYSIGANIAEGAGRGTYKDNARFVRIARGSLNETRHWLRRAYTRRLLTAEQVASLQAMITRPGPQLNAYLTSIGPKGRRADIRASTND